MDTETALPLDGAIIILMLEKATADRLEFELQQLGADVRAGTAIGYAARLTRLLAPFAVIVDPEFHPEAAEELRIAARDVEVTFIQYTQDGFGHDSGIRIPKTAPVSTVVETIVGLAAQ